MTFRPTDPDEFFQTLGADRVRKALVNGEVRGETERAAIRWLDQYDKGGIRRLTICGLWVALGVCLVGGLATIGAAFIP